MFIHCMFVLSWSDALNDSLVLYITGRGFKPTRRLALKLWVSPSCAAYLLLLHCVSSAVEQQEVVYTPR